MDVNGTRFHLLLGKDDWLGKGERVSFISRLNAQQEPDLIWDEARAGLSLRPLLFRFPMPLGDQLPRSENRRGAGRDRYGNWYWIADSGTEIRVLPTDGNQSEHFWSVEDLVVLCEHEDAGGAFRPLVEPLAREPLKLSGLAVTEHHYLVVGVLEPAGLLVFDLHAGGPPIQILWPPQVPFAPFDMAPAPGGGVWILDHEPRYWALDRYFRVITNDQVETTTESTREDDFQPEASTETEATDPSSLPRRRPGHSFPKGISLGMTSPVDARYPQAIEALPDGTVLILDSDPAVPYSVIYRYHFGQLLGRETLEQKLAKFLDVEPSSENPNPYALRGYDIAFLPDPPTNELTGRLYKPGQVAGTLYIAASDGNQTFAFDFKGTSFSLDLLEKYFPMRLFSGKALITNGKAVYYDLQDRWVPLVEQPRPRYELEGTLETDGFDGKKPDCVWHRLLLDACIPPGTAVWIESRAANTQNLLEKTPWQMEPYLYRRGNGPELPYYQAFLLNETKREGTGTWELLFQRAQGRYLQLKIMLQGTGRSTPRLQALRIYYPRFSYLKEYLPALYQDDATSASFLDRFLANMEGTYTVLEGRIEQVQALFDVRITGAEFLDWLAGWFGVVLNPDWDEARRRLFLSHIIELFNQRATPAGLIRSIRLAIDPCPDDTLFEEDVLDTRVNNQLSGISSTQIVRYQVRIIERFLTRSTPGVVYGDPADLVGPGLTTPISDWTPAQGAEPLHQRYRNYLKELYHNPNDQKPDIEALSKAWGTDYTSFDTILFSPILPANPATAMDWGRFTEEGLGFTYATVGSSDESIYQAFLARRYQQVERLNNAYQLTGENAVVSFDEVKLPEENDMPSGGQRLYDWIQFVSLVLPIRRNAHRFTVLVPTDLYRDQEAQERQLGLVQRIVELEKPAHTIFEVKPYWALFRVGEARLGLDTLLDRGSRFVALVLGKNYLGDSFLAPSYPWNVPDRIIAGRDLVGSKLVL
jgi:phage tail-like protein